MDAEVFRALAGLFRGTDLGSRAVLIGGQAIQDWHAHLGHIDRLPPSPSPTDLPRATRDIDVAFQVANKDVRLAELHRSLEREWERGRDEAGNDQTYRYQWRENPTVTVDLVCEIDGEAKVKQIRCGSGGRDKLFMARLIPKEILLAGLVRSCHRPELAGLGVSRLNHAGLACSKCAAVIAWLRESLAALAEERQIRDWACEREGKDLQDLQLLTRPAWIDLVGQLELHADGTKTVALIERYQREAAGLREAASGPHAETARVLIGSLDAMHAVLR